MFGYGPQEGFFQTDLPQTSQEATFSINDNQIFLSGRINALAKYPLLLQYEHPIFDGFLKKRTFVPVPILY